MATLNVSSPRMIPINEFYGINECPDGDTGLKYGEAADMLNFRITKEKNLQIRPGYSSKCTVADGHPVRGMWHGYVAGVERWLLACNGHIYSINLSTYAKTDLGTLTDAATTFFPFNNKVYIMNSSQYKSWDGTTLADVAGYIPVFTIATAPATGTGTALQQVNKLIASRWIWYSSTSSCTVYQLPETSVTSVDAVYLNDVLKTVTTHYTVDLTAGTVTFLSANSAGTNDVKIRYTKNTTATAANRALVLAQKFAEPFNGYTDNRIFLYGDGTNKVYYSDLEYTTGLPTAEYFPDLNVMDVGESNTPVTSMIRHFNKLMTFKSDGTWVSYYGTENVNGTYVTAFYTRAIEKDIGNTPYGQVKLVNNYPISLNGNSVYRWGLVYSSGTQDERAAKRISDKVRDTLSGFTLSTVVTFDDEFNREFWIVNSDDTALVYQYANEADTTGSYLTNPWYIYDNIPATCFVSIGGELYFGSDDGYIMHMSRSYYSDNGSNIEAYWESGSMAFGAEERRKNTLGYYVSLKPESGCRITTTLQTNNKSDFAEKVVTYALAVFNHVNFGHMGFNTNHKPQTKKVNLNAMNYTYLKLIFSSDSASATATITSVKIPVSDIGKV